MGARLRKRDVDTFILNAGSAISEALFDQPLIDG